MFFNFQMREHVSALFSGSGQRPEPALISFLSPISELFSQIINTSARSASIFGSLITGIFNGFIPCPMIYAFLIKASMTYNPINGMEIMLAMGLGTFPGMLILGRMILFKDKIAQKNWLLRVAGLIVCYLGVMSIMRGIDAGMVDNCCRM
jgi:hypothetical protein